MLDSSGADIRDPAVSWNGQRIAFAARASADQPLRLYWMNRDGSGCEPIAAADPGSTQENGILIHDFDPTFAPDGRLVFASTRGNIAGDSERRGPTRTPSSLQPNANLYVLEDGNIRQLTFLLNQEIASSFMNDGRLIFTAEKREFEFHQLALRRQNLDGADYHPLFAQRESVGYRAATEVVELPNRNLVFIASHLPCDRGPASNPCAEDGAGSIMIVNRSIGPDQDDRSAGDRDYIHSMYHLVPGAFGTIPDIPSTNSRQGVYRSPSPLPTGRILSACEPSASDLQAGPFSYRICETHASTGSVRDIGGEAGMANLQPIAIYARPFGGIFQSRRDEVNARTRIDSSITFSELTVLDWPLLSTLLFDNIREPRPIDEDIAGIRIWQAMPPPTTSTVPEGEGWVTDSFGTVYQNYRELGMVRTYEDGSLRVRLPGGIPLLFEPTDRSGNEIRFDGDSRFSGRKIQREQTQLYPGEFLHQSFPRALFDGICGTCHGSLSGRELDNVVNIDVLTSASRVMAAGQDPVDLR